MTLQAGLKQRNTQMTPTVTGRTALFLDIDGTLLDMARTPDLVKVPAELRRALEILAHDLSGALAFVSGRSLDSIDTLFAPFHPAAIGSHGGEIRGAGGELVRVAPLPDDVRQIFVELAGRNPGLLLEDKGVAMSLHYRLAPEARPLLQEALEAHAALFTARAVNILHGKAVIDVRPVGVNKGTAVTTLMHQPPFAGRHALFGGDDTTDLDVFHILPRLGGKGFSVGRRYPGVDHVFDHPRSVRQWLVRLAEGGVA